MTLEGIGSKQLVACRFSLAILFLITFGETAFHLLNFNARLGCKGAFTHVEQVYPVMYLWACIVLQHILPLQACALYLT